MKNRILILTTFLFFIVNVSAQTQIGYTLKKDSLHSAILNQTRVLSIYLPEGYDSTNNHYPVIYFLDAEWRYQHLVSTTGFLSLWNVIPKAIIVGVFNIDRNHDFLPASASEAPTGGGADNFIQFFKRELIPYIDNKFKTKPYRVLEGHSYGGVFAMHTLLMAPDLFDGYIVIDPSLGFNNQMLKKTAQTEFLKNKNWKKSVFITGRKGIPMNQMGITPMIEFLKNSAPKELNWKLEEYTNEDHLSVAFKSVYDGLRFIFDKSRSSHVFSENNKDRLDSLLDILNAKNKAMGSLTISKNGTVLYSKTIGYRFISDKEKRSSTNITKYRIGSISKMFTATMVFQLIEEGKIKLSTTLDTYFPNIPNAGKITIGNLLNHRSGIHNFTADSTYTHWMTQPKTQEEMLAIISKNKVDFQPNEKFSYSNSNYVILGYIIEKITKQSYSKNLAHRITSKIGLENTYYGGKTDIGKNESFSYDFKDNWTQSPETDMSIPGGAGAIVSTPTDLTKFIEALFSLKLISEKSLDQMETLTDGYGMGMFVMPFSEREAYGHNGGIDGFQSSLEYFPEDSVAFAYCTNGVEYPMHDVVNGVLSIYFNKNYSIPKFEADSFKTIILTTEDLDKYLGVYSSTQIPLKITISKQDNVLFAQATGQSSFPLQPAQKDKFKFEKAGILMEFNPEKNEFVLKQGEGNFIFTKEK